MSGMQLIDTNALLNVRNVRKVTEYDEGGWGVSYNAVPVEAVKAAHVIDAVPVVRCKECKHRGSSYSCPMRKLVMPFSGPGAFEDCTEDDGYCHLGEKMERGVESGCEQSST